MNFNIKEIAHYETWDIRHQVMWPDKNIDYIKLKNDEHGLHYGLFINHNLVSVVSLFFQGKRVQFRKFATVNKQQGKGYGTELLKAMFNKLSILNIEIIWCNARKDKVSFYTNFGMEETNIQFTKGGIDYIVMEKKLVIR